MTEAAAAGLTGPTSSGRSCAVPAVIFLDVDGVLSTPRAAGWGRNGRPLMRARRRLPDRALCPHALGHLNALCAASDADVVITSSWRLSRDVPAILKAAGFTGRVHEDWRTDAEGPKRSDEIRRWVVAHGDPAFVALDDWAAEFTSLRDRLVLTDSYVGLDAAGVRHALDLLGKA